MDRRGRFFHPGVQQEAIRRTFTSWIKHLLRRKAGASNIVEIGHIEDFLKADAMFESWLEEANKKGSGRKPPGIEEIERVDDLLEAGEMLIESIEIWIQQAWEKGLLEGQAKFLSKLLTLRFGALPPEAVERLAHATQDELDAWGEAIFSVPTLAAVFETHRY